MPSRAQQYFKCLCEECMQLCEKGPDGAPLGITMAVSQRTAHLNRVKAEAEARLAEQAAQEAELASELAAMTLLDGGPNLDKQPNRFWTSRDEFQRKTSQVRLTDHEPNTTTSMEAIVDGFQRLHIDATLFPFASSPDIPALASETTDRTTPRPAPNSKRDTPRNTIKAHRALDTVEQRVQISLLQLDPNSKPTVSALTLVESELVQIQTTFDNVTVAVHSVNIWKIALKKSLSELRSRILDLRQVYPFHSDKPLEFNSG